MSKPVPIDRVADELESLPDEMLMYINRTTGEFLTVPVTDLSDIENGAEIEDGFEFPWTEEDLETLRAIAAGEPWLALPDRFEIHEWSIMERFARQAAEPLASRLSDAIRGKGAFRRFRDVLDDVNALDSWYEFKHEHVVGLLQEIFEEEGIPFHRGRE